MAFSATATAINADPASSPCHGASRIPSTRAATTSGIISTSLCMPPMKWMTASGLTTPIHTAISAVRSEDVRARARARTAKTRAISPAMEISL